MRPLTQNMEPSYLVGFLHALALQIEGIADRAEWLSSWLLSCGARHRDFPWFVVVINHPDLVMSGLDERRRPRPTLTLVSCNNLTYFKMNASPIMFWKIYYVSGDAEEMNYDQAFELAQHNRNVISSLPSDKQIAPYAI